jgi:GDP-4-dehydro-6-deoxy-D-mannose reductase
VRDFCDVRDVVRAYVRLMSKGRRGEMYNVCSGKTISLKRILNLLIKEAKVGEPISVETDPNRLRRIDSAFQASDRRKIMRETGWKPEIGIEQSLRDLLAYWRWKERGVEERFA